MKKVLIITAILLVTTAIIFAIPAIPLPIQRVETYTETVTKQEPYTVKETKMVSVPHSFRPFKWTQQFSSKDSVRYFAFVVLSLDRLRQKCNCDYVDFAGLLPLGNDTYICVASGSKIRVSWNVDDSERSSLSSDCAPHYGFKGTLSEDAAYIIDSKAWQGDLEFDTWADAAFLYLRLGYDSPFCSKMSSVNTIVDIIWYNNEMVDADVTKYRDIQVQEQKQRTVTDYQKVSVWQRIFAR